MSQMVTSTARKTFSDHFATFSTATVIRVFNFIRTAEFCAERLFWCAVLVAFSAATILNVVQTIGTFVNEPTASQISFVANITHGIRFPDAKMCVEMKTDNLVALYGQHVDDAIAVIGNDFLRDLASKLARVHLIEDERSAMLETELRNLTVWDYSADKLLHAYHEFEQATFDVFTEGEVALLGLTAAMLRDLTEPEINPLPFHKSLQQRPSLQKLYRVYVAKNTNFSKLLRLTAEAMCVLMQVRVISQRLNIRQNIRQYTAFNFCKHAATMFFGRLDPYGPVVCYHVRGHTPFAFYSSDDEVAITMHPRPLYQRYYVEPIAVPVDVSGLFAMAQQPEIVAHSNSNSAQAIVLTVWAISTSLSLRRSGCWEGGNRRAKGVHFQCELWCRVESIARSCDCAPLVGALFDPPFAQLRDWQRLRSCALSADVGPTGDECRRTLSSSSHAENCSQECYSRNCETMIVTSALTTTTVFPFWASNLQNTSVVRLRTETFVYQKVDEYLIMDAKGFVANLGGNLSLYLGASFLALIHIVVFFVKLPFELSRSTRVQSVEMVRGKAVRRSNETEPPSELRSVGTCTRYVWFGSGPVSDWVPNTWEKTWAESQHCSAISYRTASSNNADRIVH